MLYRRQCLLYVGMRNRSRMIVKYKIFLYFFNVPRTFIFSETLDLLENKLLKIENFSWNYIKKVMTNYKYLYKKLMF